MLILTKHEGQSSVHIKKLISEVQKAALWSDVCGPASSAAHYWTLRFMSCAAIKCKSV